MARDPRDLLREAAPTVETEPDLATIDRRVRRRRLGRVTALAAGAVIAAATVVGVATGLVDGDGPPPVIEQPDDPVVPDAAEDEVDVCSPPTLRPTYLPWLEEGEAVPEPVEVLGGTQDEPTATLTWWEDPEQFEAGEPVPPGISMVHLSAVSEPDREPGSEDMWEQVEVRGHVADLVWVETVTGSLSLSWREEPGPCGVYGVWLYVQGDANWLEVDEGAPPPEDGDSTEAVLKAIEQEIVRIADSLVDEEGPAAERAPQEQVSEWMTDEQKEAWEAEHGQTAWIVGYFFKPDYDFRGEMTFEGLEPRWQPVEDEAAPDRQELLARSLAALAEAGPAALLHLVEQAHVGGIPWPDLPESDRRITLKAATLDGARLILDFEPGRWATDAAVGTSGEQMMLLQVMAVAAHHYPEAEELCVLVDGEETWLFSHGLSSCPHQLP
jgi:hypothetical protein